MALLSQLPRNRKASWLPHCVDIPVGEPFALLFQRYDQTAREPRMVSSLLLLHPGGREVRACLKCTVELYICLMGSSCCSSRIVGPDQSFYLASWNLPPSMASLWKLLNQLAYRYRPSTHFNCASSCRHLDSSVASPTRKKEGKIEPKPLHVYIYNIEHAILYKTHTKQLYKFL